MPPGAPGAPPEQCPRCRKPREARAAFCTECGHAFEAPPQGGFPPPPQQPGQSLLPPAFQQPPPSQHQNQHQPPQPGRPPQDPGYPGGQPQQPGPPGEPPAPGRGPHPQQSAPQQSAPHQAPPAPPAPPRDAGPPGGFPPPPAPPGQGFPESDWTLPPPAPPFGGNPAFGDGPGYGGPPPAPEAPRTAESQPSRPPAAEEEWVAVVAPDREYFTAMLARSGPEAAQLNLPAYSPEQRLPLDGPQVTIGRRRHSTGEAPDIDLSQSPEDPGVSHQHAMLVRQPDGEWAVVDQDSTNGTTINGGEEPIQPYVPVPLREGDRVHVGAWTTITVRRG